MQQGQSTTEWETVIPPILEKILSVKWVWRTMNWEPDPRWQSSSSGQLYCFLHHVDKSLLVVQLSYLLISSLNTWKDGLSCDQTGTHGDMGWKGICPLPCNQNWTCCMMEGASILARDMLLVIWWGNKWQKKLFPLVIYRKKIPI